MPLNLVNTKNPYQGFKARFLGMKGVRIRGRCTSFLMGLVAFTLGFNGRGGEDRQPSMNHNIQGLGWIWDYLLAWLKVLVLNFFCYFLLPNLVVNCLDSFDASPNSLLVGLKLIAIRSLVITHGDAMDSKPLLLMVVPPWAMSNVFGAKGGWLLITITKLGGSSKLGGNTKPCNLRPPSLHNHGEPKLSSPPFVANPLTCLLLPHNPLGQILSVNPAPLALIFTP
jgi:hypothetical protein